MDGRTATRRAALGLALALAIGAAGAGCESIAAVVAAERPAADVVAFALRDLDPEGVVVDLDVSVTNPYDVALPVSDLAYAVTSRDRPVARGRAETAGIVPPGGFRTFSLPAEIRFADVLAAVEDVRPGGVVPYAIDVELSADAPGAGTIGLPLRHEGELPVPAPPRVELAGIEWTELTLAQATATVALVVQNPNSFALDVAALDYALALGGTPVADTSIRRPARIAPDGTARLEVPLTIRPRDLGLAAFETLRGDGASYALDGALVAGTRWGPLTLPLRASGRTSFR